MGIELRSIGVYPNSMFAFVPMNDTWHCVREVKKGSVRVVVNATLFLPGNRRGSALTETP